MIILIIQTHKYQIKLNIYFYNLHEEGQSLLKNR
jgi:hypothetical protein